MVEFEKSHGGRERYFSVKYKKDLTDDCAVRAIAHGTGIDYIVVYKALFELAMANGWMPNDTKTIEAYLKELGWEKHSPMRDVNGKKIRLKDYPLDGRYLVYTTNHITCIDRGVLRDTYDCRAWCGNSYWQDPQNPGY
jgi:hypothetical protein|tara:strand:- start:7 stop:420 length:414 start_codon:yes stop_codon:yes gene_type:complete